MGGGGGEERGEGREGGGGRLGDTGAGGGQGGVRHVRGEQVPAVRRRRGRQAVPAGAATGRGGHRRCARAARAGLAADCRSHLLSGHERVHSWEARGGDRTEFQEVLSDILLGMAAGLKRDPIVILRIDGEDLRDFVDSPRYELEAAAIFPQIGSEAASLRQCLLAALHQLNVDHGMPPASDPWVVGNVIEPALQQLSANQLEQTASQDVFFEQLKKLLGNIIERLQEQPVIVAHTENTFDGSGVKRLLANKFELDKLLDSVWKDVPIEHKNKASKEYLRVALDKMAGAASLPPYGVVNQVDAVVNEAFKMANADDGKAIDEAEFKKLLTDVLGAVMLQLNGDPIFVSTNTVVHEPLSSSSTLLSSPPVTSTPSE